MLRVIYFLLLTFLIASCHNSEKKLFSLVEDSNISFVNKLEENKNENVFQYRNFYNGGGVAVGDLNNDGLPDLFFTANQGSNKLYLNKGNLKFEDISVKAGFTDKKQWSTGVVLVDINGDGWLDIYVCNAGNMFDSELRKNQLFINNHDLTFTESAKQYGLDNDGYTTQVTFFDCDQDGDLDCFMVNNSPIPVNTLNYANNRDQPSSQWNVPDMLKGGGDHLYRNDNGHFVEVTKEAGIHGGLISLGLGVNIADVNGDGLPDIYVSNDFFERDYLYINQGNGKFVDELEKRIQHTSLSSMGADIQDINNDGYPDIFTTDMLPDDDYRLKTNSSFENYDILKLKQKQGFYNQFTQNALQINNGKGRFLETGFYSGVAASDWSWGALIFDADNDGKKDIFVCNGIYRDVTDQDFIDFFANDVMKDMVSKGKKDEAQNIINKMPSHPIPNKMFKNIGNFKFQDVGKQWGFNAKTFSNGAVYADLDNDGDLDLVINNVNQKAMVYRNNSREDNKNNYIAISLKYKSPNTFAIGSNIKIYQGNQILSSLIMPSRGFQSSVDYKQTIGLGNLGVDSMTITWPDNTVTKLLKPEINKSYNILYSSVNHSGSEYIRPDSLSGEWYQKISSNFEKHTEDDYVDFYAERGVPFMLSRQGPKAAVADVNGDGLEDIYIGGAKGQAGQLYIQTKNGFVKRATPDFNITNFNDVTVAFFFDCDHDGDLDLFVGGGGNFAGDSQGNYANLLFINDGKGNFSLKKGALPLSNTNCGTAIPIDYDGDGNLDLFIGSRSVPQNYGKDPQSYILHNNGKGEFVDVTNNVARPLSTIGMVTSAAYIDINGDGKKDLIITGEYMYPHIYSFTGKTFEELKNTGLENAYGWWQSMAVADMDLDGHPDIILGNLGKNFYLSPDQNNPVKMWMSDFNNNGNTDKIFTRTYNGKDVPVFMKRDITDQIPMLKKLNLNFHDYALKTIQQLFGADIAKAQVKKINNAGSCIAFNDGKGHFMIKELPIGVQFSSVNAIKIEDINKDGYPDIIAAGNFFDMLPQFCRLDASYGHLLINNKQRSFEDVTSSQTGINVNGQTRDIVSINYQNDKCILFLENNDFPQLYKNMKIKKATH